MLQETTTSSHFKCFVDKTDLDEDELDKEVERIANQYPNNPVIIDDIPLED